jgi:hypothetical protein
MWGVSSKADTPCAVPDGTGPVHFDVCWCIRALVKTVGSKLNVGVYHYPTAFDIAQSRANSVCC